ncbi:hypothetical protein AVEN_268246-1 [Araneus ventricosus]|uniref:Uncharacterized protein n=1 Tax=Araneus ventricosus TaxID=182803 RepID=A0A4Y2C0Z2_ARAVE|nr:hypothetical protein AVEN_268246-1 [Araneus ventricosus]
MLLPHRKRCAVQSFRSYENALPWVRFSRLKLTTLTSCEPFFPRMMVHSTPEVRRPFLRISETRSWMEGRKKPLCGNVLGRFGPLADSQLRDSIPPKICLVVQAGLLADSQLRDSIPPKICLVVQAKSDEVDRPTTGEVRKFGKEMLAQVSYLPSDTGQNYTVQPEISLW